MAIFQNIGKKLSDAAQTVGKRTSEAAEVGRLNGRLMELGRQEDRIFEQIGRAHYAARTEGAPSREAEALCAKVDALRAEAADVQKQIDKVKRQKRCPHCGEIQPRSAAFCASCGTKLDQYLDETEAPEAPEIEEEKAPEAEGEAPDAEEVVTSEVNPPESEVEIRWPDPKDPSASA